MPTNIADSVRLSQSTLAINTVNNFLAQGGTITYDNTQHSQFINHMINGVNVGGTININVNDVNKFLKAAPLLTPEAALAMAYVHELGHFVSATQDAHNMQSTEAGRENACYLREGESAIFQYNVATEARANGVNFGVTGVTGTPDLYYNINATSMSLTPFLNTHSDLYQRTMLTLSTLYFARDPQYQAACKVAVQSWGSANFVAPDDTPGVNPEAPANIGWDGNPNNGNIDVGDFGDGVGDDGGDFGGWGRAANSAPPAQGLVQHLAALPAAAHGAHPAHGDVAPPHEFVPAAIVGANGMQHHAHIM